jgi:hypothetical protein
LDTYNLKYGILQQESRDINPSKMGIFGLSLEVRKKRMKKTKWDSESLETKAPAWTSRKSFNLLNPAASYSPARLAGRRDPPENDYAASSKPQNSPRLDQYPRCPVLSTKLSGWIGESENEDLSRPLREWIGPQQLY